MAFLQMELFSESIGMMTGVNVIIPERASDLPSVLYLLHGLSDDQSAWVRRTSVERYAEGKNLAVIMPTTHRGFYTDMADGYNYWTYISKELPEKMHSIFRLSEEREKTFAAGLSMGGYGALKLGLRKPEAFAAVAGFSSAADMRRPVSPSAEHKRIFGNDISAENDLFAIAEKLPVKDAPRIYMWCGTEDFLLDANRRLSSHLKDLGFDIDYSESAGGHQWERWDEQIKKAIDWFGIE
jgi:S-formylglutathione hydrolase FrmB